MLYQQREYCPRIEKSHAKNEQQEIYTYKIYTCMGKGINRRQIRKAHMASWIRGIITRQIPTYILIYQRGGDVRNMRIIGKLIKHRHA